MNSVSPLKTFAISTLALLAATCLSQAQVLIFDDFSGGSGEIHGTAPDTGSGTWNVQTQGGGNIGFQANGAYNNRATAGFAFTFVDGNIYSLSANLTPTSGSLILFMGGADTTLFAMGNDFGIRLDPGTPPNATLYTFPNAAGAQGWDPGQGSVNAVGGLAEIRLNTTTPGAWTASFFYNGAQFGPAHNVGTNPTYVGIGSGLFGAGTGTIDNFTLQILPVPEPSTGGLALAGLGLVAGLRRRRK